MLCLADTLLDEIATGDLRRFPFAWDTAAGCKAELFGIVKLGHRIQQYAELVREHGVDLLVLEGKDESQSAMSGVSYSLAVELRSTPVLIL